MDKTIKIHPKNITTITGLSLALIFGPLTTLGHTAKTPNPTQNLIAQRCNSKYRLVIQPTGETVKVLRTFNQNAEIVGTIEDGTIIEFRGWDNTGQWAHIISPGEIEGWIWGGYITCNF
jgi:hypothetical protein